MGIRRPSVWRRRILAALAPCLAGAVAWWTFGRSTPAPDALFASPAAERRYMAAYDAVLQRWPIPYEARRISTTWGLTHVIASGSVDSPPLVLLHAALATSTVWRPNVEALSRMFRVYAIDILGQGGKTVASRQIEERQDFSDWLNQVFDGLGIRRASIVGNSYGGFVALNQAALAPDRVDRIVLISPAGVFSSVAPFMGRMAWGMVKAQARRPFGGTFGKPDLTLLLAGKGRFNPGDEDWLALGEMLLDSSVVRPSNIIWPSVFSSDELRAIKAPTLLLIAEYELLYDPHAILRLAQQRMPGIQAEVVPKAHHLAAMAQPDIVDARIVSFVQAGTR
jgi:pimeloyl-ACP methyl ester carboxylesterase